MGEDTRTAATITVTLSTQLIAAALGMLAAEGALIAFILGSRAVPGNFYLWAFLTLVAFVASIYFGGSALHATREAVFRKNWTLLTGMKSFFCQTFFAFVGLVLLAVLLVVGLRSPPKEDMADKLTKLNGTVESLSTEVRGLRQELESFTRGPQSHSSDRHPRPSEPQKH